MTDRFTEATKELETKNAFICDSCGSTEIRRTAETGGEVGAHRLGILEKELGDTTTGRVINSDPTPFGV